ncbi:hypothetical protein Tsubulata_019529 [Turnera subulata]|uniref:Uncharacterized protein n=1 Tax=Turnera subulata TaxID=218843 RepID=A0A9Q0J530_9ROSI|nr:hypothetical protein Tsubulata_019529 [Turnera subulata]
MKFPEDGSYLGSNNSTKHLRQPAHNTQREVLSFTIRPGQTPASLRRGKHKTHARIPSHYILQTCGRLTT